jgi:acetylornithine/succinyldiaminopimelate/putrescine aminotransferase
VPGVKFLDFNKSIDIEKITISTACVLVEPIQGEGGIILPAEGYLKKIKKRCDEVGALLIFDEIQTGFGRTGTLFAFEQYNVVPDVFTIAKAMGGGLPIGAFVSSQKIMSVFKSNPTLGHITTFGGHPVSCAAASASLSTLLDEKIIESIPEKEMLLRSLLIHDKIQEIRGKGLFFAVDLGDANLVQKIIHELLNAGIVVDWFLFDSKSFRIAPPLIISEDQIYTACSKILKALDSI